MTPQTTLRKHWGRNIAQQRAAAVWTDEFGKKQIGISRLELADQLGVTEQAVGAWERGEVGPKPEHQVAIARVLGVSWAVLFQPDGAA